uniref:Uncharacterized protein n=1 Tax=Oryza glumipatula TaxID=40148 RepID=A0A0D9Z4C6_9ORYZ
MAMVHLKSLKNVLVPGEEYSSKIRDQLIRKKLADELVPPGTSERRHRAIRHLCELRRASASVVASLSAAAGRRRGVAVVAGLAAAGSSGGGGSGGGELTGCSPPLSGASSAAGSTGGAGSGGDDDHDDDHGGCADLAATTTTAVAADLVATTTTTRWGFGAVARGPDEATTGAPTPPTRGFGSWLRGSRAQARCFFRFFCKLAARLRDHERACQLGSAPT